DEQPPSVPRPGDASSRAAELTAMLQMPQPGVGYRSYKAPPYEPRPGDEVVPYSRRRRITADHMVYSQHVAPHLVTVSEIDMTKVARQRDAHKNAFEKDGSPLTF